MAETKCNLKFIYTPVPDGYFSLSPAAKLTWTGLCSFAAWKDGRFSRCFPGNAALVDRTGLSRSTIKRALHELMEAGFIVRQLRLKGKLHLSSECLPGPVFTGGLSEPEGGLREPRGAQREPGGAQREPRWGLRGPRSVQGKTGVGLWWDDSRSMMDPNHYQGTGPEHYRGTAAENTIRGETLLTQRRRRRSPRPPLERA